MLIIAHRGNHDTRTYPENSREALNLAYGSGAHGVEIDLRITQDSALALMHDASTALICDTDLEIAHHTRLQLASATLRGRVPGSTPVALAFFDEIFSLIPSDQYLFIELKDAGDHAARALELLACYPLQAHRHRFISFHHDTIVQARRLFPAFEAYLLGETHHTDQIISAALTCQATGIDIQISQAITGEFAQAVKSAGLSLHVWGVVTDEQAAAAFNVVPESITTDRPGWLAQKLRVL